VGTVTVRYIADPLRMAGVRTEVVECVGTAIDCVRRAFPDLDLSADLVIVRGVHAIDPDALVSPGETLAVAFRPLDPTGFTYAAFWKIVVTALVSAAISYLVAYLTRPKQRNKNASPAYSVNIEQNAARLGGTIPIIYGRVMAMPDIAAQAYAEFASHNERVSMLLCLGMGEFTIHDIYIGETRVSDFPSGNVTTFVFPPSAHRQTLGVIEAATGVCEDMFTIPETAGIDLAAPNDPPEVTVSGSANGGVLTPDGTVAGNLWVSLRPGQRYFITTSSGASGILTFVGIGANNSAVFDGPLPSAGAQQTIPITGQLVEITDSTEGQVMQIQATAVVPNLAIGDVIFVEANDGIRRGPYQVYRPINLGPTQLNMARPPLRISGPGFVSGNNTPIRPQQAMRVLRNFYDVYYIAEYNPNTSGDAYRWRGWYVSCRAGQRVDKFFVDVVMPSGIAWVTDKGDYNSISTMFEFQIQQVDDNSAPIGGVSIQSFAISGATSNPRRVTFPFTVSPGRYRVRIARTNSRDQRASKEISKAELSAIRARIWHAAGTPAYENCTLLAMQFTASAGLNAASNRRIKVDCTRRLYDPTTGTTTATSNPAAICYDAYTNAEYGSGRPASEFDVTKFWQLAPQWATVGFNGVFDQPTTLLEALQAILVPVRAIPLPIGSLLSVSQDAPRSRSYVFGPETLVGGTLSVGYNFDGVDNPDCLEVIYTDPSTFNDARVFYPSQGVDPETVELFGVTSQAHALAWAKLRWQEKFYNRKTCQFELEGEGYLLQPMTRFALAVPALDWGTGGIVVGIETDGVTLTLDTPVPTEAGSVLYFKDWTGRIGSATPFQRISDRVVKLLASPGVTIKVGDQSGDGTRWVATRAADRFFEFTVANLEASGPMRVRVTGQQYTAAKYVGTFLENWVT